jgi:hypothetical protein
MCLAVYLGSSEPLQEIAWDYERPAFYLEEVDASEPSPKHFSVKHAYYAGSHRGCGCGFLKDGESVEERARCQTNYDALATVIRTAVRLGAAVQLFTCWDGDQDKEPEAVRSVTVGDLSSPDYVLEQLELLHVTGDA